jgi:hypothetical protein
MLGYGVSSAVGALTFPMHDSTGSARAYLYVDNSGRLYAKTFDDRSSFDAVVQIWYVKT